LGPRATCCGHIGPSVRSRLKASQFSPPVSTGVTTWLRTGISTGEHFRGIPPPMHNVKPDRHAALPQRAPALAPVVSRVLEAHHATNDAPRGGLTATSWSCRPPAAPRSPLVLATRPAAGRTNSAMPTARLVGLKPDQRVRLVGGLPFRPQPEA